MVYTWLDCPWTFKDVLQCSQAPIFSFIFISIPLSLSGLYFYLSTFVPYCSSSYSQFCTPLVIKTTICARLLHHGKWVKMLTNISHAVKRHPTLVLNKLPARLTVCLHVAGVPSGLWYIRCGGEDANSERPISGAVHPDIPAGQPEGDRPALCGRHAAVYNRLRLQRTISNVTRTPLGYLPYNHPVVWWINSPFKMCRVLTGWPWSVECRLYVVHEGTGHYRLWQLVPQWTGLSLSAVKVTPGAHPSGGFVSTCLICLLLEQPCLQCSETFYISILLTYWLSRMIQNEKRLISMCMYWNYTFIIIKKKKIPQKECTTFIKPNRPFNQLLIWHFYFGLFMFRWPEPDRFSCSVKQASMCPVCVDLCREWIKKGTRSHCVIEHWSCLMGDHCTASYSGWAGCWWADGVSTPETRHTSVGRRPVSQAHQPNWTNTVHLTTTPRTHTTTCLKTRAGRTRYPFTVQWSTL